MLFVIIATSMPHWIPTKDRILPERKGGKNHMGSEVMAQELLTKRECLAKKKIWPKRTVLSR